MSNCYKCGRELPNGGIECEPFCFRAETSDESMENMEREYLESTAPIDWDKVKTFEDLVLLLRNSTMIEDRIDRSSPAFEKLKRFLKDEKSN